ncbi:hypothetical protein GCM10007216_30690 [Thalassobacillus devorans]|uniref:Uncharacterized protein n=1 Tax=Thalassobacillus devorans TaxID=279813 RepID=A0ABQ1PIL3_9BACI|nr:hypothetical protein [Thalassobacillus devorans]NIK30029.1 hypothetical protein [Thalassobacillus devorans]GGC97766.1 hypothetical protein GCM10007216_30690 [Thalassobacillus devorans]
MKKRIDFDNDLESIRTSVNSLSDNVSSTSTEMNEHEKELDDLFRELNELIGANIKTVEKQEINVIEENKIFLELTNQSLDSKLTKEIQSNKYSLNKLDRKVVIITSLVSVIVEILIVRIPRDINYISEYKQAGSAITEKLKSIGSNEDLKFSKVMAFLEKRMKVPYDCSINNVQKGVDVEGLTPRTHRMMNPAHDPLVGMIFAIVDTVNGQTSLIDSKGKINTIKTFDVPLAEKMLSPLIWLGHLLSDISSKMGLPAPGWGFTQLLQFGELGDKNRNIAEIARFMYLKGYDLRHFATMSLVPGIIELTIRGYYYLSKIRPEKLTLKIDEPLFEKEMEKVENAVLLNKMLLFSHSIVSTGNAIKLIIYRRNPLAINYPQWLALLKESSKSAKRLCIDSYGEKIIRNRITIDERWSDLGF